jgi:hypothetical protein
MNLSVYMLYIKRKIALVFVVFALYVHHFANGKCTNEAYIPNQEAFSVCRKTSSNSSFYIYFIITFYIEAINLILWEIRKA